MDQQVAKLRESEVRSYNRTIPATFATARDLYLVDDEGQTFVDFLSGCGSLNYGHNNTVMKAALLRYLAEDGPALGLDLHTVARDTFLEAFDRRILAPRCLEYRLQFTGPTGTNAVEAAIKLARKATGRTNIIAFTNAFHGCSLGSLSLTANRYNRSSSSPMLTHVHRALYDGYLGRDVDTSEILRKQLNDASGGLDEPAAIVVEVIQGEGGLNVASRSWIRNIASIAEEFGAVLIVDDIQAGCGRSGRFFSFEEYGIKPDVVTMAKSVSGFGLPMSIVLLKPELDVWSPGEHNGTFRGNNHAFVTATAALDHYWADDVFEAEVRRKANILSAILVEFCAETPFQAKGRGLMQGIDLREEALAKEVKNEAYRQKIIVELCGPRDEILKLMPPLTINENDLVTQTQRLLSIVTMLSTTSTLRTL